MTKFQDCGCVVFTFIRQIMGCAENKHNKCYGAMLHLNIPYGQSSAKLSVIQSFGHLVIW